MPTTKMLRNSVLWLLLCMLLVFVCYQFVDKQLALWIYHQQFGKPGLLHWFITASTVFEGVVVLIYIYYVVRFSLEKVTYLDRVLLALVNSMAITYFFKAVLKFIFARYWPLTWFNNNPSLISNNVYGFNFFHFGHAYESFPSGHAAMLTAALVALWLGYPKLRWLCVSIIALVYLTLLVLNYHFLGDIIAGGFLGALVACWVNRLVK